MFPSIKSHLSINIKIFHKSFYLYSATMQNVKQARWKNLVVLISLWERKKRRGQDNRSGGQRPALVNRTATAPQALRTNTNICFFWTSFGSRSGTRTPPQQLSDVSQSAQRQWRTRPKGAAGLQCGCCFANLPLLPPALPFLTNLCIFPHVYCISSFSPHVWLNLSFQSVQLIQPQRASILSWEEAASPAL